MNDVAPHNLDFWEMATWSEADAEAAVARYRDAGPEAIAWLEDVIGQRLVGSDGLAVAWQCTVAAILSDDDSVDSARLTFALAHLYALEVQRREPRFVWGRYDDPLKAKVLGYNMPALRAQAPARRDGAVQVIPTQICANSMGRVERYKSGELDPSYEDILQPTALHTNIENLLTSLQDAAGSGTEAAQASGEMVRVPDDEVDGDEAWERMTDQPELRNVEAIRTEANWQVHVWVAEYVREEPLESELCDRMTQALQAVPGATRVIQEDREVWSVDGTPGGDRLLKAACRVVDDLADRAAIHVYGDPS